MRQLLLLACVACDAASPPPPKPATSADPTHLGTFEFSDAELLRDHPNALPIAIARRMCAPACGGGVIRVGMVTCPGVAAVDIACNDWLFDNYDHQQWLWVDPTLRCPSPWIATSYCPEPARHACDQPCTEHGLVGRRTGEFECGDSHLRAGNFDCGEPEILLPASPPCKTGWVATSTCTYPRQPPCKAPPDQCCDDATHVVPAGGAMGNARCRSWDGYCSICICLASSTRIATPDGDIPVTEIREGMPVYSRSADGRRIVVPVLRTHREPVPDDHALVHLVLADGRTVDASAGHPDPTGTKLGDLAVGLPFDGSTIESMAPIRYRDGATYDLLPASETGVYWANGIPLGSTLKR